MVKKSQNKSSATSPEVEAYVSELKAENKRLNKKLAKCQVQLLSANNRIAELEKLRPVAKLVIRGLGKDEKD
jgi:hypothetical protein